MTLEDDLHRLCGDVARICTQRMFLDRVTAEAEARMVEQELPRALRMLSPLPLEVVVFGCTSASIARGPGTDAEIRDLILATTGAEPVTVYGAVVAELHRYGAQSILCVTPYPEELGSALAQALVVEGLAVKGVVSMGIVDDTEIGQVAPEHIQAFVMERWSDGYDAVFISCTNLRAAEVAGDLQKQLEVPVTTSNLAVSRAVRECLQRKGGFSEE
jgi:maleate isomerase